MLNFFKKFFKKNKIKELESLNIIDEERLEKDLNEFCRYWKAQENWPKSPKGAVYVVPQLDVLK